MLWLCTLGCTANSHLKPYTFNWKEHVESVVPVVLQIWSRLLPATVAEILETHLCIALTWLQWILSSSQLSGFSLTGYCSVLANSSNM